MTHIGLKFPGAAIALVATWLIFVEDPKPMVAITFDDGHASVYDTAFPILESHGMVATNYVTLANINQPDMVDTSQLFNLAQAEWEIGAHGVTHADMTQLDAEELSFEMIHPVRVLAQITGQEILSFSSPYGEFNDTVLAAVEKTYFSHVNAWSPERGLNTVETFDEFNVHRLDMGWTTPEEVCLIVDTLPDNSLFVIIFHDISDGEGQYQNTVEEFEQVVNCINNADVNVVRVSDGIQAMLDRAT